jgi:uncharacterized OB-fold protein
MSPENAMQNYFDAQHDMREGMIEEYIAACTECGGREFPKRSDCDGCTHAVDECLAEMARSASSDADRYAAATRAIATGAVK